MSNQRQRNLLDLTVQGAVGVLRFVLSVGLLMGMVGGCAAVALFTLDSMAALALDAGTELGFPPLVGPVLALLATAVCFQSYRLLARR